jgi:hypothetical protein
MNYLSKDVILQLIVAAGATAHLVDTTDYAFSEADTELAQVKGATVAKPVKLSARDGTLYGDDLKFENVQTRVGAVAVCCKGKVLAYSDSIVDKVRSPKGGDVIVPFSKGILVL